MAKLESDKKHKIKGYNIIKYLIFGLVLLAPLFAVGYKCWYVATNPNAENSYYGETINEYEKIYNTNSYDPNTRYYLDTNYMPFTEDNNLYVTEVEITDRGNLSDNDYNNLEQNKTTIWRLYCNVNNGNPYIGIYYYDNNNQSHWLTGLYQNTAANYCVLSFKITGYATVNILGTTYKKIYNNYSYLDNAFYYAIEELNDQPIFNWTKNTGMYTVIDGMTSGLEFGNNNVLALLLTYWIMNTLIFCIFNIVILTFEHILKNMA